MDTITNFDKLDAPCIKFAALPSGMGAKVEVGDTIIARKGPDEVSAQVIEIDKDEEKLYLTKELPREADYSVEETSTGQSARYDGMKKGLTEEAKDKDDESEDSEESDDSSENVLTGPLPALKKLLIQISIEEGD